MTFKYTTKFQCAGSILGRDSSTRKISVASLDDLASLRSLAPSDEEIMSNPDLMYVIFNGAVTSLVNLNHDCLDNDTAARISKSFINKYIDIEHDRSICVGTIVGSGFSTFKENQIIEASAVEGSYTPHNMSFCGAIWKTVDKYFAEMVEESNKPESWFHRKVSASWEIGFNEYAIIRGSRNLGQAEIITDPKEVDRLSKYLLCEGGSGFDDTNTEIYRLIKGDVVPLGMGLVRNPAASVNGVSVIEVELEGQDDEEDTTESPETPEKVFAEPMTKKSNCSVENRPVQKEKIISQSNKINVKSKYTMKFKDTESLLEALEVSEASAVSPQMIREHFEATIDKAAKEYKALEEIRASKEKELSDALTEAKESSDKLAALAGELATLKQEVEDTKRITAFNERMNSLSEKYDFNDEVQKVIAKQIRNLSDDEYSAWLSEDAKVILAAYEKKEEKQPEKTPEEILKESTASTKHVPNAGDGDQPKVSTKKSWKLGEDFNLQK